MNVFIDPLQGHQVSQIEGVCVGFLHVLIQFHYLELIVTVLFLNKQKDDNFCDMLSLQHPGISSLLRLILNQSKYF